MWLVQNNNSRLTIGLGRRRCRAESDDEASVDVWANYGC